MNRGRRMLWEPPNICIVTISPLGYCPFQSCTKLQTPNSFSSLSLFRLGDLVTSKMYTEHPTACQELHAGNTHRLDRYFNMFKATSTFFFCWNPLRSPYHHLCSGSKQKTHLPCFQPITYNPKLGSFSQNSQPVLVLELWSCCWDKLDHQ